MQATQSDSKPTLGERCFGEFSWPEGRIPTALAGKPVPLKLGIIEDVKARLPSEEHDAVQTAIARWARGVPYIYATLEPDAQRIDLDGNPVEEVTAKHRDHARGLLEHKQINRARKQHREAITALNAIDRIFSEPSRENLTEAKKATAELRRLLTWK